jgi:hypothetical protein
MFVDRRDAPDDAVAGFARAAAWGSQFVLIAGEMARRKGFEPLTPRFEVWCSIQLSYRRCARWV